MEELMWLFIWQYKRKFVLSIDMTIQKLVYIFYDLRIHPKKLLLKAIEKYCLLMTIADVVQ